MPQNETKRAYTLTDADLKQTADALLATINRDIAAFATRNITQTKLELFSELIADFDATSTDDEMFGLLRATIEQKDAIAATLHPLLRTIRSISETTYKGKGYYHVFGWGAIRDLRDNELYQLAKRIYRVASRLKEDLIEHGLTQGQLTELSELYKQLDKAIDECGKASEDRDLETQDRITKGNALYTEMMRLAGIGKSLFEDSDEARYNDYVLIGSHSSTASPTDAVAVQTTG